MANKIRILISDNSKEFVWLLVKYLSKYPEIEIIGVAYDGRQTFKMIEKAKPDIVLLDLIMPDIDGLQVIKMMHDIRTPLKIFVISAVADDALIEKVMKLGTEKYFTKPIDLSVIAAAIISKNIM